MQISDAKAAVGKEWETSKHLATWDFKNSSTSESGAEDLSISHPHGPLQSQTLRACQTSRTYKGSVVLLGDNGKDDSGYRAAFTEQGASALQVAAARFLDAISRLLAWRVKQTTQFQLTRRCTRWKHQDYCDCRRKSARKCG